MGCWVICCQFIRDEVYVKEINVLISKIPKIVSRHSREKSTSDIYRPSRGDGACGLIVALINLNNNEEFHFYIFCNYSIII